MSESSKNDPSAETGSSSVERVIRVDESGIHRSYYEKYRAGLESMLQKLTPSSLTEAEVLIQTEIEKEDENFDLYHDWKKAVSALKTLLQRDHDTFLEKIAQSPNMLEPLLSPQSRPITLSSGLNQTMEMKNVQNAVVQLSGVVERLAMYKFPNSITTINERRKEGDQATIEEIKKKIS